MTLRNLSDVLVVLLRDLFSAELQISYALQAMERDASTPRLKDVLRQHRSGTEEHIGRLTSIGSALGIEMTGTCCRAMEGLIDDCKSLLSSTRDSDIIDAGIIASLQKMEHYEIGAYGTTLAFARLIGANDIAELLTRTLEEEKATDQMLYKVAVMSINRQYLHMSVS